MDTITKPPPAVARSISPDGTFITSFHLPAKSRPQHLSMQSMQSINSCATFDSVDRLLPFPSSPASTSSPTSPAFSQDEKSPHTHHMSMSSIGSFSTIDDVEKGLGLPEKRQHRVLRHARHTFLNVYRRLFSLVFIFNMIGLGALLSQNSSWVSNPPLSEFATAASANIMVALLIRQDYVVNACFKLTWLVPLSAPLRLRRMLAKVYEYGGVHSGAAVSSVVWFLLLTIFLTMQFAKKAVASSPLLTFTYVLLILLFSLCITAYPKIRFASHNTFENIHRWAGWFSLALFWAELVLFARTQITPTTPNLGLLLIRLPAFWFLLISSLHAILPWLRLHKLPVRAEALSSHATRLHFTEPVPLFVGLRISDAPLREWHSFACIPSRDGGKTGGSVLISSAGDWTRKTIANPQPYYWIKGIPVTGVLCMARIFKSVIIVTTGSGIGPCLGVMQDIPNTSVRVIWSTPSPERTYGPGIVDAVKEVDPKAWIWDTRKEGRPDLVRMAWDLYREVGAEAVFVISNPKLTRRVVYGMESRGVPAFGPIWDS